MASCIQQHDLKCFEQPCIDMAPFSLCKPHLFASALQQTETGPNTEQRIKCQNNIVQYMYIYIYIFCSKWVELTKIVWKKQLISKALIVHRSEQSGKCKLNPLKIEELQTVLQCSRWELFECLKRERTRALYLILILQPWSGETECTNLFSVFCLLFETKCFCMHTAKIIQRMKEDQNTE